MLTASSARSACEEYAHVLSTLKGQLARLDRAGAHKAAAHLDAAIQQLRRDQLALNLASAAQEKPPTRAAKTAVSAPFVTPKPVAFPDPHVVARKAKPANAR